MIPDLGRVPNIPDRTLTAQLAPPTGNHDSPVKFESAMAYWLIFKIGLAARTGGPLLLGGLIDSSFDHANGAETSRARVNPAVVQRPWTARASEAVRASVHGRQLARRRRGGRGNSTRQLPAHSARLRFDGPPMRAREYRGSSWTEHPVSLRDCYVYTRSVGTSSTVPTEHGQKCTRGIAFHNAARSAAGGAVRGFGKPVHTNALFRRDPEANADASPLGMVAGAAF
jgi:hypothetical protein